MISIQNEHLELEYYPNFLDKKKATAFYEFLIINLDWGQDKIKIFGREVLQPRLTALYAENSISYTYSGLTMHPKKFPKPLKELKDEVDELTKHHFTTCLANLYRDGNDSMGWHADDEKILGKNPVIASLSLGVERKLMLKHKNNKLLKESIVLEHGSLLIMKGETQHYWKHQIAKSKKINSPRINLTFRTIL